MTITFPTWLHAQVDREDAVGDLARDYREDCRYATQYGGADEPWVGTPEALREHLLDLEACEGAFTALDRAEREWECALEPLTTKTTKEVEIDGNGNRN